MITETQLQQILPNAGQRAGVFVGPLNDAMAEFQIDTLLRQPPFIASVGHESQHLQRVSENLNYKPAAIIATFNTSRIVRFTQEQATRYGRTSEHPANQEMIANIAYANRNGNGDVDSGDGWRYRGAGLIQLTFKNNQHAAADYFGIPYDQIGDWLRTPEGAARSAGWFWMENDINPLADREDMRAITRVINGGYNGLEDRMAIYERAKQVLGA